MVFLRGAYGVGVTCEIFFTRPKGKIGPFSYHIHDQPLPSQRNCSGTRSPFDPYHRGQADPCDPAHPEACQLGDLSGKHGLIPEFNGSLARAFYTFTDPYISTNPNVGAFIGSMSFIIRDSADELVDCSDISYTKTSDLPTKYNVTFPPGLGVTLPY